MELFGSKYFSRVPLTGQIYICYPCEEIDKRSTGENDASGIYSAQSH
jgi:hypothetical protein